MRTAAKLVRYQLSTLRRFEVEAGQGEIGGVNGSPYMGGE
jgi:hypothetical protein